MRLTRARACVCVVSIGVCAAAYACNVYDPSLLETGGPPAEERRNGIGWWSKDDGRGCFTAGLPRPEDRPAGGTSSSTGGSGGSVPVFRIMSPADGSEVYDSANVVLEVSGIELERVEIAHGDVVCSDSAPVYSCLVDLSLEETDSMPTLVARALAGDDELASDSITLTKVSPEAPICFDGDGNAKLTGRGSACVGLHGPDLSRHRADAADGGAEHRLDGRQPAARQHGAVPVHQFHHLSVRGLPTAELGDQR